MTLSAVFVTFGPEVPVLQAGAPLPIEALVLGESVTVITELLPRLFTLCRSRKDLPPGCRLACRTLGPIRRPRSSATTC